MELTMKTLHVVSTILPQVAQAHYPTKLINIIHTSTTYKRLYENYPITLKLSEFWQCEWWKMCIIYQNICFWQNLLLLRADPVNTGLPTFSSFLSTVIWGKKLLFKKGIKQCLGGLKPPGLKCSQNTKKNKKMLKVSFKAIFNAHFANLVSKEYFSYNAL